MSRFKVTSVVDGDTFEVTPEWKWNGNSGTRVRPTGYDAPEMDTYSGPIAKRKLENLILGKEVELSNAVKIDRGRIVCDVYYNGKNLSNYFPEYQ